jgi:C-terminal processing protease CtpA/Prc
LFNKQSDTLQLQIRDSLGLRDTVYIRKISKDSSKLALKKKPKKMPKYKGTDEHGKPLLDLTYLNSDSTAALLKVRSFSFSGANHSRFYRESFADIKQHHVNMLILDLRYNGGGTLQASRNLFAYLTDSPFVFLGETYARKRFYKAPIPIIYQINYFLRSLVMFKKDAEHGYTVNLKGSKPLRPKADNYTSDLKVLINGSTFSASSLLSANLKEINRATFIGEETGGGFNECSAGYLPLIKLPNTRLILRMPLYRLAPNTSTRVKGHGIFPDVEVLPKVSELKKGMDVELERAMRN